MPVVYLCIRRLETFVCRGRCGPTPIGGRVDQRKTGIRPRRRGNGVDDGKELNTHCHTTIALVVLRLDRPIWERCHPGNVWCLKKLARHRAGIHRGIHKPPHDRAVGTDGRQRQALQSGHTLPRCSGGSGQWLDIIATSLLGFLLCLLFVYQL